VRISYFDFVMDIKISTAKRLHGTVPVPGDKSVSHRALMISALANGESEILGFLDAADPQSTLSCIQSLGVEVRRRQGSLRVKGKGLQGLRAADSILDAGNSGTTIRLLSGILAGQPFTTTVTGDESLRQRPMKRIIEPLSRMGAAISSPPEQTAPLTIQGSFPLHPISFSMERPSAQVKSAVLLAGLFGDGTTKVTEMIRTRDHTERMLGLPVDESANGRTVTVDGGKTIDPRTFQIPADISSAAFFIAAATLVPGSEVRLPGVGLNPTRIKIVELFRSLGASIDTVGAKVVAGEPIGDLLVKSSHLQGTVELQAHDVAQLIDEVPIIAVTLALSGVSLSVRGGGDLRNKESDRIRSVVTNLRHIGLDVDEYPDGFAFQSKKTLIPSVCDSFGDHRIAMAFGIAGLVLKGETTVQHAECVEISFPSFWGLLLKLQQD